MSVGAGERQLPNAFVLSEKFRVHVTVDNQNFGMGFHESSQALVVRPQNSPDQPCGCLVVINSACVTGVEQPAVGGFDEGYFLYVEDTDLCKRWRDKGWEVSVDPRVTVTHDWQGGSRRDPKLARIHRASVRRYFHMHHRRKRIRNSILFAALGLANLWDRWRAILTPSGRDFDSS